MGVKHDTAKSFSFAFEGIKTAFGREPNFKIHVIIGSLTLIMATFLGFSSLEWLILFFTISLVLILELVNTALESIVNLVSPGIKEEARVAKDVSAGAVLISAITAIIVACILFFPKILILFLTIQG